MPGLLGKKIGMTSVFTEEGVSLPVTLLEVGPCKVYNIKNLERDGYQALQIGYGEKKEKKTNKAQKIYFEKHKLKSPKILKEFKNFDEYDKYKIGDEISIELFDEGDKVVVTGITKGKGFQGVM